MILAGDVGATKTVLAIFRQRPGKPELVRRHVFDSRLASSLNAMVRDFMAGACEKVDAAVFGVAGPVDNHRTRKVSLNWTVDRRSLTRLPGIRRVEIINDLEATARGLALLPTSRSRSLTPGLRRRPGLQALAAPGTGMGTAGLLPENGFLIPFAGEGGHRDFAPVDETGYRLHRFLKNRLGSHVSVERICGGDGFRRLLEFVVSEGIAQAGPTLLKSLKSAADRNAMISEAGYRRRDPAARAALKIWVDCFGAVAGDLVLTLGATGGLWIGGGIAPQILPALSDGRFLRAFRAKGRMQPYMEKIPVRVILEPHTALLGAAALGAELGEQP